MRCPHCQQEHEDSFQFCPVTGKEIPHKDQGPEVPVIPSNKSVIHPPKSRLGPVIILLSIFGVLGIGIVLAMLFLKSGTTREQTKVPTNASLALEPTFNEPSLIAFALDMDSDFEIFTINPDGSGLYRLTDNASFDGAPAWSADGKQLVYVSDQSGDLEIWKMDRDGSHKINLTNSPGEDNYPDLSPDGKRITFESKRDGNSEIYVMNADGNGQTRLTNNPEMDGLAKWSPDSAHIVFTSVKGGNADIYIMDSDGKNQVNLSNNPANEYYSVWSPDGTRIGFDSDRTGRWEFYTMNPDGSDQIPVISDNSYYGFSVWSPDGRYLLYNTSDANNNLDIFILDVENQSVHPFRTSPSMEVDASWSPGSVANLVFSPTKATPVAQQAITEAPQPTLEGPVSTGSSTNPNLNCGVVDGTWSNLLVQDNLSTTFTITNCKITMMYTMGQLDNQWIFVSHDDLMEEIKNNEVEYEYNFNPQDKYYMKAVFTSSTTANLSLLFYKGFRFTDTLSITEDYSYQTTLSFQP